jgi:hypothetical protein
VHIPMSRVRVLEVAQYTFVPSAAAILADWGRKCSKSSTLNMAPPPGGLLHEEDRVS